MRKFNELENENIIFLEENGIDFTTIEPTRTGLDKSIMDATKMVRDYLAKHSIHNYENQQKGPEYKMFIKSIILTDNGSTETVGTMYRPKTKKGDPRIWINVRKFVEPNDILAIIVYIRKLYVINITRYNLNKLVEDPAGNTIKDFLTLVMRKEIP